MIYCRKNEAIHVAVIREATHVVVTCEAIHLIITCEATLEDGLQLFYFQN